MEKYDIELAVDTIDAEEFRDYLIKQGHDVIIGKSTGSYVNDVWTALNGDADMILNDLWEKYCADEFPVED